MTELVAEIFRDSNITLILCHGKIEVPTLEMRPKIITEYHDSLIGGHKGTTKTYRAASGNDTHDSVYGTKLVSFSETKTLKLQCGLLQVVQDVQYFFGKGLINAQNLIYAISIDF